MITLASLFDGISGFPLAGQRNSIVSLWASEIEPFPLKVSAIRYPNIVQHGDITKINGAEVEPVDIITGGSPCQDLSVAGKRAGLAGERSGLFMEQIRIVREMRNADKLRIERRRNSEIWDRENAFTESGKAGVCCEYNADGKTNEFIRPRFMVWENVPGAFSSNKGEDFRAVLEETARIADETIIIPRPPKGKWNTVGAIMGNGWSIAWRVLDAQYWGVPQRRRRIFLVADFGGQSAPEILFKREGLRRDIAESRETRKRIAGDVERGTPKTMLIRCGCDGGGKGPLIQDDKSATLSCNNTQTLFDPNTGFIERIKAMEFREVSGPLAIAIDSNCQDSRFKLTGDIVSTVPAKAGTGGSNGPMLAVPVKVYGICSYASNSMKSDNPHSGIYEAETSRTLDQNGGSPACNQGGIAIVCAGFKAEQSADARSIGYQEQCSPTLPAEGATPCVITCASKQYSQNIGYDVAAPLCAEDYKEPQVVAQINCQPSGIDRTYQKVTSPLMANSHPGSYTGQDAYSDMLVTPYAHSSFADYKEGFGQLRASGGDLGGGSETLVKSGYSVRRLTPLECERLQGFPDGWTDITWQVTNKKGKVQTIRAKDSPRYKVNGNSIAVCCAEYVLEGIREVLD